MRVSRDFWQGLYSSYVPGILMGLFQACRAIDFSLSIQFNFFTAVRYI